MNHNNKDITILITGATGFLGSYILEKIASENYKVIITQRSHSNLWRINNILDKYKIISYNIDIIPIESIFKENKIDIIIHAATNYGRNNEKITQLVKTNLIFPISLIEVAILYNVKTFINIDTLLNNSNNPYVLSKKQYTEWLKIFSKNIQIINLKLEHLYGPKDDKNKFVMWILSKFYSNDNEIILTKGEQLRDFIYIDDAVNAFMLIFEKRINQFEEYEIGSGNSIKLKEFVLHLKNTFSTIVKKDSIPILQFGALPYKEGECMEIKVNINKLKRMGWYPQYTLIEGLKKTILWYDNFVKENNKQ